MATLHWLVLAVVATILGLTSPPPVGSTNPTAPDHAARSAIRSAITESPAAPLVTVVPGPAFGAGQATPDRSVTFAFAPPHGTTFVEVTRIEKEVQIQPDQPPQRQIIEQRATYLVEKLGQGYLVSVRPMRPKDLVASDEAERVAFSMLSRMDLKYELDSSGRAVHVEGIESGLRMLTQALGKEMMQAVLNAYGSDSLDQVAINEWNNRALLGAFAGERVPVGKERSATGAIPLPIGGIVTGTIGMAVQGPVPCDGARTCYSVKVSMKSADERIGRRVTAFVNDMMLGALNALAADEATKAKVPKFGFAAPSVTSDTERLIDPATGLPFREISQSTVAVTLTIKGTDERASFRFVQKQTSRFEYK